MIANFNGRLLDSLNQLPVLTGPAAKIDIHVICIQERISYHKDLDVKYPVPDNKWKF